MKQEQLLNQIKEQREKLEAVGRETKKFRFNNPAERKTTQVLATASKKKGPADSLMISKTNMWKQLLNTKADSSSLITDQKTLDLLKRTRTSVDRF